MNENIKLIQFYFHFSFFNLYFFSFHSTASLGIQTLTKEYNNFDGSKKSGATGKTREESIKEDVTLIRKNTKPICLAAKNALKAQKEKLKTAKDAELRMREQSFGVTAKSFIDSVKGYQNAHVGYEEAVRSTMRRTLEYAVGDSMTSEEKEKVIDEGRAQQVCNDVMMNGRGEVANVYKDVTEQHNVSFLFGLLLLFFFVFLHLLSLFVL